MTARRKKKKDGRGGKRKGAGRKAGVFGAGVVLPWRVPEQLVAAVEQRAAASGQNPAHEHSSALARGLGLAEAPNTKVSQGHGRTEPENHL